MEKNLRKAVFTQIRGLFEIERPFHGRNAVPDKKRIRCVRSHRRRPSDE